MVGKVQPNLHQWLQTFAPSPIYLNESLKGRLKVFIILIRPATGPGVSLFSCDCMNLQSLLKGTLTYCVNRKRTMLITLAC